MMFSSKNKKMASPVRVIMFSLFFMLSMFPFSTAVRSFGNFYLHPHSGESSSSSDSLYEVKYFTQILDHFNFHPKSYETFQQRYLINDTHWGGAKKAAPIFVYTGNEGNITWFAQNTGFMFDIAPRFNALLVFIEHRYYGDSIPFGGTEVAYSNATTLGYLSSTQALADYATLIIDLKKNLTAERSPVIVFGGSYGGMLAAWFRLKYPHVAIGALASSSPILQFDDIVSPYAFNDVITKDYKSESESCYRTIKGSWKEIDEAFNRPGGIDELEKSFHICKGQLGWIISWIQTALVYAAMTDYPTESNFLQPLPAYPVRQMCKAIDDPTAGNNTFAKLYGAMNIYYNHSGTKPCLNPSDSGFLGMMMDGWYWQACTEMIMPTQGNSESSIFPASTYNYSNIASDCEAENGVPPRPHWITTEFGGHDIKRVLKRFGSNIIFFNGLKDPWSAGGVLESLSKSIVAIVSAQGAHHVDLRFTTNDDPKWLKDAREKEIQIMNQWLQEYYNDLELL